jgi:transglutaminase-like putative cysteine protease
VTKKTPTPREPLHQLALRALVYSGAVFLFVGGLASTAATAAAAAVVPAGLLLGRSLAASRLRWPARILVGLGVLGLGWAVPAWLGTQVWFAELLGTGTALTVYQALHFGLLTLGVVVCLRLLAALLPAFALLEVALLVTLVAVLFMGHRDDHVGQPRFFFDWAWGRGHDPATALLAVGLAALLGAVLLLLCEQGPVKTAATLALVLLLGLAAWCWPVVWQPVFARPAAREVPEESEDDPPPQDGTPVAVVLLHDDYRPVEKAFYFRTGAFSQFNGQKLVRATRPGVDADVADGLPGRRVDLPVGPRLPGYRKSVRTTVSLVGDLSQPLALVGATALKPRPNPDPKTFHRAYAVTSEVLAVPYPRLLGLRAGSPAWSEAVRRHYLAYPNDPRYRKLAEEIAGTLPAWRRNQPFLRILATRRWMEEHAVYSRKKPPVPAGTDMTTAYLFGSRRGYCVHIAHAMAYLLRAQGIPARVGHGFAVEATRAGQGSSVLVLTSDAHAWCEVYLEGVGWVVMDPNVKPDVPQPRPHVPLDLQRLLGERARARPVPDEDPSAVTAASWAPLLAGWGLGGVLGLLACLYLTKGWRRLAPRLAAEGRLHRACYRSVLDRLAELRLVRRRGETREEFAARLSGAVPELVPLTAAHVREAVTGTPTLARRDWLELMSRASSRIAGTAPWYRRLLGALNPVSWLRAR